MFGCGDCECSNVCTDIYEHAADWQEPEEQILNFRLIGAIDHQVEGDWFSKIRDIVGKAEPIRHYSWAAEISQQKMRESQLARKLRKSAQNALHYGTHA